MYLFTLAGLCFLVFLAKLRSRLLAAEGGTGELTSLVVASGAVFVALLCVAAASRGLIGFAIKANDESLPDPTRSVTCRRPATRHSVPAASSPPQSRWRRHRC